MAEIEIRKVWASNLISEFGLIKGFLDQFPIISMDTEFPGTVFTVKTTALTKHLLSSLSAADTYAVMKRNVDALRLIQLGLTLSDPAGALPLLAGRRVGAWEFNFADFDSASDLHNPASLALLRRQGIDFAQNRLAGIDSRSFAVLFKLSGLHLNRRLAWVTFHGAYDLGFMVKILTGGRLLPSALPEFVELVDLHFGPRVYDVKPVARACGLHGGLEAIGKRMGLERALGRSHQAGSDSLLTMLVFVELMKRFGKEKQIMKDFNYVFFGLTETLLHYEGVH
ncbi:probable CCR4-associated factor 1 homolog 11 [Salvia hispanica]|uniref:probable CCR4-associated factor 1 homolog 11 n=1 Tax=Salvia hispanica TaxID=49212 RepID=UPI0020092FF3|nr:probable CCR4-associated factor 1 homolog 11 [Salvia hispanica]